MKVELELWHLILLFTMFVSVVWAFGKALMDQFEKRLDERFKTRDENTKAAALETKARFDSLDGNTRALERDLLNFKAQLPEIYVRREDYIRGQAVIEAKIDALAAGQSELKTLVAINDRS